MLVCFALHLFTVKPAWSGLPLQRVTKVSGTAAGDSRKLASGSFMLKLSLNRSGGKHGAEADAGGTALVFFRSDPVVSLGERLTLGAELSADEEYLQVMRSQKEGAVSMLRAEPVLFAYAEEGSLEREGWSSPLFALRAGLLRNIKSRCDALEPGAGGLFTALFTGCRDSLSASDSELFRKAGCSHILALSGMHLGIISGILLLLLRPLPGRKIAFFISCFFILAYLFLTGFGVSLVRAAVMYFFAGLSYAFYRKTSGLDVLMLSFIGVVVIDPASFYTVSFQLSFLAVGGIIIFTPLIARLLKPWLPAVISLPLACSVAAQLAVSPLLAYVFGSIYPAGLAAGIIIAPMVTVFIWTGIIYLCTALPIVSAAAGLLYRGIFKAASVSAEIPAVNAEGAVMETGIICAVLCIILFAYKLYRRKIDGVSGKL